MIKSMLCNKYGAENVLRVTNLEGLKKLNDKCYKAIIFDDVSLDGRDMEEKIAVVDVENDSDIRVLYNTVRIPAGMPRAVLTNRSVDNYFNMGLGGVEGQWGAIIRRLSAVDLKGKKVILRNIQEVEIEG
jgi:hypothetical protein